MRHGVCSPGARVQETHPRVTLSSSSSSSSARRARIDTKEEKKKGLRCGDAGEGAGRGRGGKILAAPPRGEASERVAQPSAPRKGPKRRGENLRQEAWSAPAACLPAYICESNPFLLLLARRVYLSTSLLSPPLAHHEPYSSMLAENDGLSFIPRISSTAIVLFLRNETLSRCICMSCTLFFHVYNNIHVREFSATDGERVARARELFYRGQRGKTKV